MKGARPQRLPIVRLHLWELSRIGKFTAHPWLLVAGRREVTDWLFLVTGPGVGRDEVV